MFAIHGHLLPHCDNYADAVHVWENAHVHPRFESWRGLKDKRDTSKIVRKDGDKIIFRYNRIDLITWEPNCVWVQTHDSVSSGVFLNRFLPSGMTAKLRGGSMYIGYGDGNYQPKACPLKFTYDGRWVLDEDTAIRFKTHKFDQSKGNRIRATLKPFLDWKASVDRIRGYAGTTDGSDVHAIRQALKGWLEAGHIPEDQYALLGAPGVGKDYVKNCYVLGGAVTKCEAPLGSLRPKDEWSHLPAWHQL